MISRSNLEAVLSDIPAVTSHHDISSEPGVKAVKFELDRDWLLAHNIELPPAKGVTPGTPKTTLVRVRVESCNLVRRVAPRCNQSGFGLSWS